MVYIPPHRDTHCALYELSMQTLRHHSFISGDISRASYTLNTAHILPRTFNSTCTLSLFTAHLDLVTRFNKLPLTPLLLTVSYLWMVQYYSFWKFYIPFTLYSWAILNMWFTPLSNFTVLHCIVGTVLSTVRSQIYIAFAYSAIFIVLFPSSLVLFSMLLTATCAVIKLMCIYPWPVSTQTRHGSKISSKTSTTFRSLTTRVMRLRYGSELKLWWTTERIHSCCCTSC